MADTDRTSTVGRAAVDSGSIPWFDIRRTAPPSVRRRCHSAGTRSVMRRASDGGVRLEQPGDGRRAPPLRDASDTVVRLRFASGSAVADADSWQLFSAGRCAVQQSRGSQRGQPRDLEHQPGRGEDTQPSALQCHDLRQLSESGNDVTIRTGFPQHAACQRRSCVFAGRSQRTVTPCRHWLGAAAVALAFGAVSCATAGHAPDRGTLDTAIRGRVLSGIRVEGTASLPPDASIEDGLTSQEAVAIALWNSPSFQATLADLGLARADLVEAGLLRNPVFSFLFPVGPKQLEWTLQFPFETLWQRPRRMAAARLNAQAVGERLVWDALTLVAQTRTVHAEAVITDRRLQLTIENADLVQRLAGITEARLRAGDISELEARAARSDAARVQVVRRAVEHDRNLARLTLAATLGLDAVADQLRPVSGNLVDPATCGTEAARLEDALASRPDVRAAEIGIEAAAQRARWERSRVLTLIGILDANGSGKEGFEVGPGVNVDVPLFSRNQGAVGRADAEVERASRQYAAVRAQVVADVRSAAVRVQQAQQATGAWQDEIVPSLEIEQRQAESAYQAGEIPLFTLLDVSRRLVDGRTRLLDAEADLQRATIALERSIGRSCAER